MVRVMIVDDAAFMRMMIRDILEKDGYEVIAEAENGLKAIDLYKKEKPDIVMMDITMPGMNGIEALKEIKKIDPSARIIMCSAMGQDAMVNEALNEGAKAFVVKPFQPEMVLDAVKKINIIG